jgi:Type IV secretory system Conjugative DNA transfer
MNFIFFLFCLQTIIILAWYHFPFPKVLNVDFDQLVYVLNTSRLYQILNVLFLLSIWIKQRKRLSNMFHFLTSRRHWLSLVVFLIYLGLVTCFLEPFSSDILYREKYIVLVTVILCIFPFLFPKKDAILNPRGFKESELSFELLGKNGQRLPVNHPETGIFIVGGPGSGKTKSVIEPILFKMIQKGYCGVLYDYDFSSQANGSNYSLSQLAYNSLRQSTNKSQFISINFQDLSTSSRINPISPIYIHDRQYLSQCLHTLFLNLDPQMRKDFWNDNAYALLKGIIVFLEKKHPQYCTLPHAILLGLQPAHLLMSALQSDDDASMFASPILDAFRCAPQQLGGVTASFKVKLQDLIDNNLFWVLSGDEVPLVVNDPSKTLVICLGNTPTKKDLLSPILAMIMAVLTNNMYGHGRNKSFVIIDELPTLILPNLSEIPATARKYKVSTVVALQNIEQLEDAYQTIAARKIRATFSNQFIGRGSFSSAKEISEMLGKEEIESVSTTKSDKKESTTTHQKQEDTLTVQEAMDFQTGEFGGRVVHKKSGRFKMKLAPLHAYDINPKKFKDLPKLNEFVDVEANFAKLKNEVADIVKSLENANRNAVGQTLEPKEINYRTYIPS